MNVNKIGQATPFIIVGIISEILFGDWQVILGIEVFKP